MSATPLEIRSSAEAWAAFANHGGNAVLKRIVCNVMKNESRLVSLRPKTSPLLIFDHGQPTRDVLDMMAPDFLDRDTLRLHILTVLSKEDAADIQRTDTNIIAKVFRGNLVSAVDGVPVLLKRYGTETTTLVDPSRKRSRSGVDGWNLESEATRQRLAVAHPFQCIHLGLGVCLGAGSPRALKVTLEGTAGCLAPGGKLSFTVFDFEDLPEDTEPESDSDRDLTIAASGTRPWSVLASRSRNSNWASDGKHHARRPVDGTHLMLNTVARTTHYDYGEDDDEKLAHVEAYDPLAPSYTSSFKFFYVTPSTLEQLRKRLGLLAFADSHVLDRSSSSSGGGDESGHGFELYFRTYVWQRPGVAEDDDSRAHKSSGFRRPSEPLDEALTRNRRNGNIYSTADRHIPGQKAKGGGGRTKGRK